MKRLKQFDLLVSSGYRLVLIVAAIVMQFNGNTNVPSALKSVNVEVNISYSQCPTTPGSHILSGEEILIDVHDANTTYKRTIAGATSLI